MAITLKQVLDLLSPDELDYDAAAKLGPEALPHLETIIKEKGPLLASKAAYLAGLIQDRRSVDVLKIAAQSTYPEVRVQAAATTSNLHFKEAEEVLELLSKDEDEGVRMRALRSKELRSSNP